MKKRLITALLVATGVFGAVVGLAAGLGISPDNLGSGTETVSSCDTSVDTAYTYNGSGAITEVIVSGIDDPLPVVAAACDGETAYVELLDASNAVIGSGSGPITGDADGVADSVTIQTSPDPDPELVTQVRVTITG